LLLIKKVGFLLQNFLFSSEDENSTLKAIDFGLSDYVKPGLTYYLCYIFADFYIKLTTSGNSEQYLQMRD
jgi:hypothetical protein